MHAYYINLDARPDRRARMEAHFLRVGITASRIRAVEPVELSDDQRDQCRRSWKTPYPIIEVELCCNLSHKKAISEFLSSEAEYAAIFEDDAELADDLGEILASIDRDGMSCDILRLETWLDRAYFVPMPKHRIGRYSFHEMAHHNWGAAGYVLSRKGAKALLDQLSRIEAIVDLTLWRLLPDSTGTRVLQVQPAPVVQIDRMGHAGAGSDLEIGRNATYDAVQKSMPISAKLAILHRFEIANGIPSKIKTALGLLRRDIIPFAGKMLDPEEISMLTANPAIQRSAKDS